MCDRNILQQGFQIALEYFNYGEGKEIRKLTIKAHTWCTKYYGGKDYCNSKGAEALRRVFPEIYNLSVKPSLRPVRVNMTPETSLAPEGTTLRQMRRAERRQENSEPFPIFAEPLMASEEKISEVSRQRYSQPKGKPKIQVKVETLRDARILDVLPELLCQLANGAPERSPFVADQTRTKEVVPSDFCAEIEDHGYSSDDSMASTSTVASLRAKLGKRKASEMTGSDESSQTARPNKIRVDLQWYPTPTFSHFDMEEGVLIAKDNPEHLALGPDPFALMQEERKAAAKANEAAAPAPLIFVGGDAGPEAEPETSSDEELEFEDVFSEKPSPSLTAISSMSSASSARIIKLKVPDSKSPSRNPTPASSRRTAAGGSHNTPAPERRTIILRDPRVWSSSRSTSSASSTTTRPSGIIKLRVPGKRLRSPSPMQLALDKTIDAVSQDRPSPAGTDRSCSSIRSVRIKINIRTDPTNSVKVAEWRKNVKGLNP